MPTIFAHTHTGDHGNANVRRAVIRGVLGVSQMLGASAGLVLLADQGVTAWTLAVVGGTTALTAVSVLLFGRGPRS